MITLKGRGFDAKDTKCWDCKGRLVLDAYACEYVEDENSCNTCELNKLEMAKGFACCDCCNCDTIGKDEYLKINPNYKGY